MTQEEILEGGKLIALFVGEEVPYKQMKINGSSITTFLDPNTIPEKEWSRVQLQYHSSWNWLMPVVDKIEKECSHEVVIFGTHCHINQGETHDMGYSSKSSKIESTYQAVVEFIKWYNTQKL